MSRFAQIKELLDAALGESDLDGRVKILNSLKLYIKEVSPFKNEPVDCVIWVKAEEVQANDYNPNSVAPPEMELLKTSILQDGYTQPIVAWKNGDHYEVVDGFHRNRVGKEYRAVQQRIHGYLPVTVINNERTEIGDRMASTIRHNRARGKHSVTSMSDIVIELKKRNRSDAWIAKNLGMDEDEVLRLSQISGLADMFSQIDFSDSWDVGIFDGDVTSAEVEGEVFEDDQTA